MKKFRKILDDLYYVGKSDERINLFENLFPLDRGVSYNSYVYLDEKNAVVDTVEESVATPFLEDVEEVLSSRKLDYIIINHMEPDHSSSLKMLIEKYPDAKIVGNSKTIIMIKQYFEIADIDKKFIVVCEGDEIKLGKHSLKFMMTPMVHWPESMMCYDKEGKVLFSNDAFGSFGAISGNLFDDEIGVDEKYLSECRRYYSNIVGKYGMQVGQALKKASGLDIKYICSLHGVVWRSHIDLILEKYNIWSGYREEKSGVLVVYSSMYGHTKKAVDILCDYLAEEEVGDIEVYDVSKTDVSYLLSEVFKYSMIVIASVTYNNGLYPRMEYFINDMVAHNVQNKKFAIIENGTWAPQAGKIIKEGVAKLKNCEVIFEDIRILSSVKRETELKIEELAKTIKSKIL